MNASPFGKYAEGIAAVVALAIIFTWLFGLAFNPAGITPQLDNAAWVCIGYIFARPIVSAAANAANANAATDVANAKLDAHLKNDVPKVT